MNGWFKVTQEINGAHPLHTDYPLLPGDVLTKVTSQDAEPELLGTWTKHTGICIVGFQLTPEQEATLEELPKSGWTLVMA